jgi:hypothetical protein
MASRLVPWHSSTRMAALDDITCGAFLHASTVADVGSIDVYVS